MKLPISLPFKKADKTEYFLALLLRDEKATAVIFEETGGKVHVVGEHEEHFKDSIEEASDEQWLDVIDKAISTAEGTLPKDIQTHKTIFGVKNDWVDDAKIKHDYLVKLKKVSDELALTPIGFLVITEAIAHLLSEEEGAPVSAILVEVGKRIMSASLLRAGKVLAVETAQVEESLPKTADVLLRKFSSYEVLPSRLIVFNSKANETIAQEFMGHAWTKTIPFLHVPTVVPLPKDFDAKAVLFGAASQMGFEVLEPMPRVAMGKPDEDQLDVVTPPPPSHESSTHSTKAESDFGFVMEKDIAQKDGAKEPVVLQDSKEEEVEDVQEEETQEEEVALTHDNVENPHKSGFVLPAFISRVPSLLPHVSLPAIGRGKKIVFIPPLLLALLILLFVGYIFLLKATVVLHITPKEVSHDQDVTFSTASSSDPANNIIEARSVTVSLDGNVSTSVTGKKETGDKAKGTVTLYSRLPDSRTIASGTSISGPNGLTFTLDKSVSLASSSADASASPSTASVSVTASDIGKESNLPSGSKFSVKGFDISDLVAKNDSAFSGGTKKEISVVSQKDLDNLVSELPKNLEDKAKDTSTSKVSGDEAILPILVNTIVDKKVFDKKVGQEANTVTLNATVTFTEMSYKKDAVDSYAKTLLKDDMQDKTLAKDGITYNIDNVKRSSDQEVAAHLALTARLVPVVDTAKIAQSIAGKSFDDARSTLTQIPQVASAEISLRPPLPLLPKLLPRLSKNISVTVGGNE